MNIIFEKTSARGSSSGAQGLIRAPHHALKMRRELNSFDPSGPALERSNALQTFIDIAAVLFGFLFVTATGVGIAAAIFILLFVRL